MPLLISSSLNHFLSTNPFSHTDHSHKHSATANRSCDKPNFELDQRLGTIPISGHAKWNCKLPRIRIDAFWRPPLRLVIDCLGLRSSRDPAPERRTSGTAGLEAFSQHTQPQGDVSGLRRRRSSTPAIFGPMDKSIPGLQLVGASRTGPEFGRWILTLPRLITRPTVSRPSRGFCERYGELPPRPHGRFPAEVDTCLFPAMPAIQYELRRRAHRPRTGRVPFTVAPWIPSSGSPLPLSCATLGTWTARSAGLVAQKGSATTTAPVTSQAGVAA